MTEPCRSDCPSGDCAGCAFPPRLAPCSPSGDCLQAYRCARTDATRCDAHEHIVDGMALRHSSGSWCPIFVDARGALLEAA